MIFFPPEVLLSQVAAIAAVAAAIVVVQKRQIFVDRYRRAFVFILGTVLALELCLVPLWDVEFFEYLIASRLKKDGVPAAARILAIQHKTGRRHGGHGATMYVVSCAFTAANGAPMHAIVRVSDNEPHAAGDTVSVRYLPADPTVVREESALNSVEQPAWLQACLLWIINGFCIACLTHRGLNLGKNPTKTAAKLAKVRDAFKEDPNK